jgi:preprotein translocase subunit SecF
LAKRATWLLLAVTIAATVASVLLARDRRRAALVLGLTVFAGMVVVRTAVHRVSDDAPELAATPGGSAAIDAVVGGASTGLLRLTGAIMLVAAGVAVVMLVTQRFERRDVIAAIAALAVAASFAVIGFSLVAVVVALAAAVLVPVVASRLT